MTKTKDIQVVDFESLPIDYSDTGVTEAVLAKLKEDYTVVPDCSTKEGYAIAKAGITLLRTLRVKIEAKRKKNNAGAVSYKKRNDGEAAGYISLIVALEEPMKKEKQAQDAIKEEEKRIAAIKEQERVAAIEKDINTIRNVVLDCHGKTSLELSGIIGSLEETEIEVDRFAEHTPIAEAAKIEAIEKLTELRDQASVNEKADEERKAEDVRLAAIRQKLEDGEKERNRVDDIKAKIHAIKDRGAYDPEATAEQIEGRINVLKNVTPNKDVYEEFTEDAFMAIGLAVSALQDFYVIAVEKERIAAVAAEEAVKAEEEVAEEVETPAEEEKVVETLPEDDVVDAEFVPGEHDPEPSDDDENRIEFVNALVEICPALPTPTANHIYRAIRDGRLPHVQLTGGAYVTDK